MINNLIKVIFIEIGYIFSFFSPIITYFGRIYKFIYSGYKKRCFQKIGTSPQITPLCKKINGGIVGNNCIFGRSFWLDAITNYNNYTYDPIIEIGNNCSFGDYNHIGAINKIIIGSGVLTGQNVLIEDHTHGDTKNTINDGVRPDLLPLKSKGAIIIEDNVWIGDKVVVCGGITIGTGAVVGANSVVTHDIPPFVVAGGIPAKIIRKLK